MTELNKENVCIGEKSIASFSQAFCEADIIVPDTNPDISKVLQADANVVIVNKKCEKDRIAIDGRADILIIYLGDDNKIYNLQSNQNFSHIIDSPKTTEDMYAETEIDVENIDYTVLNSRKMNVKVLMGIDANSVKDETVCLCTSVLAEEPFEILHRTVSPYKTIARNTEQICIKERLDIPNGKPSVERILRTDVNITEKSCTIAQNKVMVEGILNISVVYLSDIDGKVQTAEYEIPFTDVVNLEGIDEGMDCFVKLDVNKVYCKTEEDVDGDNRFLAFECIIIAELKGCCCSEVEIVEDAYCIKNPVNVTRETTTVNKLMCENQCRVSSKDNATIDENSPEILQIFKVVPKAYVATSKVEKGKAMVEGIIESEIMYVSTDETSPISTHKHRQSFTCFVDVPEECKTGICDVTVDIVHCAYAINLGREIDLRFVLDVNIKVINEEKIEYVTDMEQCKCQDDVNKNVYCIKVYFIKDGESLWNIAKRHRIKKERLMELNNISEETEIFAGRQIIIG